MAQARDAGDCPGTFPLACCLFVVSETFISEPKKNVLIIYFEFS